MGQQKPVYLASNLWVRLLGRVKSGAGHFPKRAGIVDDEIRKERSYAKGFLFLPISLMAMFLSLLSLKLSSVPVHAATQPKYVTEVVVPNLNDTQQAIQNALDKKAAEGWQLQTMTAVYDSNWTSPMYVLVFKK